MSNELDIVDQLLKNDKPAAEAPKKTKPAVKDVEESFHTREEVVVAKEPHVKWMDPTVKGRDATSERKDKPHWTGDCHKLSDKEKQFAGLPAEAYLYVKDVGGPNSSACVYDPVHWIYGWGNDTMEAVKDCLNNIRNWRAENPALVEELIKGWEERLVNHKHPFNFTPKVEASTVNKYKDKHIESKNTTDILKDLGL